MSSVRDQGDCTVFFCNKGGYSDSHGTLNMSPSVHNLGGVGGSFQESWQSLIMGGIAADLGVSPHPNPQDYRVCLAQLVSPRNGDLEKICGQITKH